MSPADGTSVSPSVPRTYADLRRGVEAVLLTGQREIEQAKVRTYWDTGRLINEHLLIYQDRAGYGTDVMTRLGRDLKISPTVLYRCAGFANCFPNLADRPNHQARQIRPLPCRCFCGSRGEG